MGREAPAGPPGARRRRGRGAAQGLLARRRLGEGLPRGGPGLDRKGDGGGEDPLPVAPRRPADPRRLRRHGEALPRRGRLEPVVRRPRPAERRPAELLRRAARGDVRRRVEGAGPVLALPRDDRPPDAPDARRAQREGLPEGRHRGARGLPALGALVLPGGDADPRVDPGRGTVALLRPRGPDSDRGWKPADPDRRSPGTDPARMGRGEAAPRRRSRTQPRRGAGRGA